MDDDLNHECEEAPYRKLILTDHEGTVLDQVVFCKVCWKARDVKKAIVESLGLTPGEDA